jgi:hypothetical protein
MYYDSLFSKLRAAACMSYADMRTPLRDGTYQPCTDVGALGATNH